MTIPGRASVTRQEWVRSVEQRLSALTRPAAVRVGRWVLGVSDGALVATAPGETPVDLGAVAELARAASAGNTTADSLLNQAYWALDFGVDNGLSAIPRGQMSEVTQSSGQVRFVYVRAPRTVTLNYLGCVTGATGAGATPTLCRVGVWSVDGDGNMTLIGATDNDTALFNDATTLIKKETASPIGIKAGHRYAFGMLVVTGAAMPSFMGISGVSGVAQLRNLPPRMSASLTAQIDLPDGVDGSTLTTSSLHMPYLHGLAS